jgi:hypothetical protein
LTRRRVGIAGRDHKRLPVVSILTRWMEKALVKGQMVWWVFLAAAAVAVETRW